MTYSYQDILIIGDSFCMNRHTSSTWPNRLLMLLTGKDENDVRGKGFGGCSWWSTRVELLKELETNPCPKILIFTHTEPTRIPSDYNFPLNGSTVFDDSYPRITTTLNDSARNYSNMKSNNMEFNKDVRFAAQLYYKYLISDEFNEWAIYQWFNELDYKILPQYNIPIVIHLYSFETTMWTRYNQRYLFKNGVTASESLFDLQNSIDKNEYEIGNDKNHFPIKYNYIIADQLYNFIKNYTADMNGKLVNLNLLGKQCMI